MKRQRCISLDISLLTFRQGLEEVLAAAQAGESAYACFANAHMTLEAQDSAPFAAQVNAARWVFADGKPVAWLASRRSGQVQERIAGMDFMPALLQAGAPLGLRVALYGSTPEVLARIAQKVETDYPGIQLVASISPPFRPLTPQEVEADRQALRASGAQVVMVALGCPKQERWMAENTAHIPAVLLGLGGAFPVFAGTQARAPQWMQAAGLEWLHRLVKEPRRLWKRYLVGNARFLWGVVRG